MNHETRARGCTSTSLRLNSPRYAWRCSHGPIGRPTGLATIESFRLVSHGCGVPASLRDQSYHAARLRNVYNKSLRCSGCQRNYLRVSAVQPSKHYGRQPVERFSKELSQWSSSQVRAPGRQQARHCFSTAESQCVSTLLYHIDLLTRPSRRRNRPSLRLSLQRCQRGNHLLQRRRGRPLPHAPRQPQPRPRSLRIEYHMHARI